MTDVTTTQVRESADEVSTLATGLGLTLFGRIAGRGVQLVAEVVLARALGPIAFGLYAIGWTGLKLLGLIAVLGLDQGVLKYASARWRNERGEARRILGRSLALAFASGLATGALVFAAAPWLAGSVFSKPDLAPVIRVFAAAFPLFTVLRVASAGTRVSKNMLYSLVSEDLGQPALNLVLAVVIVIGLGSAATGAAAATAVSFAIAAGIALLQVRRLFADAPSGSPPGMREILAFSVPASMAGVLTLLVTWTDRFVIAGFRPTAEVGVYQAVSQIPALFAAVIASLSTIMIPMIADLHHRGESVQLARLYRVGTRWALYACGPVFLVVCFAPGALIHCLFGPGYAGGGEALVILALGQFINVATGVCGALVVMTGGHRRWLAASAAMFAANIVACLLLVPRWGIEGAAIATASSTALLYLWGLFDARRSLKMWPYDLKFLHGLLALAGGAGALVGLRYLMNPGSMTFLAAAAVAAFAVPAAIVFALGLGAEDRDLLTMIRMRRSRPASR